MNHDTTKPEPGDSRYRSLDLWRGLACLLLVGHHMGFYVPEGLSPYDLSSWSVGGWAVKLAQLAWVGVPIFFVVSGYCIAASVDSLHRQQHSLGTFFTRRLRRIYPPLWIACAFAAVATVLIAACWPSLFARCPQLPRLSEFTLGNWIGNLCASETWQYHVTGSSQAFLMRNTWTLCFEEQFYLVAGLLVGVAPRRFLAGALVVGGVTLVCRHLGRACDLDLSGWFFAGHWLLFALGIVLFHQLNRTETRRGRGLIYLVYVLGILYAVVDRRSTSDPHERHFDEYLVVACVFALALVWLRRFDTAWMRSKLAQPLLWCGQRSYSIYLTHFPLVTALSCALHAAGFDSPTSWLLVVVPSCLATALASGAVFYHLFERHYQNAPLRQRQPAPQPVLAPQAGLVS